MSEIKISLQEKQQHLDHSESLVDSYVTQISNLEKALEAHGEETKATDHLVDKIKTLNTTHCNELEQEITRLQNLLQNKKELLQTVEKELVESIDERNILNCKLKDLTSYSAKMQELMSEKTNLVATYEEKIKVKFFPFYLLLYAQIH